MGRQRQFAEQGTGHWLAMVMPARTLTPNALVNDRFLQEQPATAPIIERQVSAAADVGFQSPNGSRQSQAGTQV